MMKTTGNSVGARVSGAADEAIGATTQALESSRQFATEVAGRIGERARDIREGAAGLARMGAESVGDATVAAQRQLGRYVRKTRSYVAHEPLKSALIAAAIGAVAAALVLAIFRHRRD